MEFDELLVQVIALLQHQGRVSYGAPKRQFTLDGNYLWFTEGFDTADLQEAKAVLAELA